MTEIIELQNRILQNIERIIREYKIVYCDYDRRDCHLYIEPIISDKVCTNIEGIYNLDNPYWGKPEFNRMVLRNFMILRSLFPDGIVVLTIPLDYRNKILLTDDAWRILINYKCRVSFSKHSNGLYEKTEDGKDVYTVRWSILKDDKVYTNFEGISYVYDGPKIEKVMFKTNVEEYAAAVEGQEYFYNSDLISDFCNKKPIRRRLVNSLFRLICASDKTKKSCKFALSNEIKIASCIAIVEDISQEQLQELLIEMATLIKIKDLSVINRIIDLILKYQSSLQHKPSTHDDQSLVSYAYQKISGFQRIRKPNDDHKKTDS